MVVINAAVDDARTGRNPGAQPHVVDLEFDGTGGGLCTVYRNGRLVLQNTFCGIAQRQQLPHEATYIPPELEQGIFQDQHPLHRNGEAEQQPEYATYQQQFVHQKSYRRGLATVYDTTIDPYTIHRSGKAETARYYTAEHKHQLYSEVRNWEMV